jgi:hypothetical protein
MSLYIYYSFIFITETKDLIEKFSVHYPVHQLQDSVTVQSKEYLWDILIFFKYFMYLFFEVLFIMVILGQEKESSGNS